MLYSFKKINIEAPFDTKAFGHSCQTFLIHEHKDHAYARVIGIQDNDQFIIHVSLDLCSCVKRVRDLLQDKVREYYHNNNLHLITSSTHTHYNNDPSNKEYEKYLIDILYKGITSMEYSLKENVSTTFKRKHITCCGTSRISGYETNNEFLCILGFYSNDENFLNVIINNAHPTTLSAYSKFFSSEMPGNTLKMLEDNHPNIDFSYINGACGDISSRFVREGQEYKDMLKIATNLTKEVESLLLRDSKKVPLAIKYQEDTLEYIHDFSPIDTSLIPDNITPREKETIEIGQEMREHYKDHINTDTIMDKVTISRVSFGSISIIFYPNEIFSEYLNYLDLDKNYLVSYSNGYGPYILPVDFKHVTYEMFMDTLSKESKLKFIELLKSYN